MANRCKAAGDERRRPRVVIVGAGFAGLEVARKLDGSECDVLLLDRRNHHLFQPLLYQVATAALSPADIAEPIRAILRRQKNVQVLLAEVTDVDLEARRVSTRDDEIAYDWLVLAAGAVNAYFGNEQWSRRAPGLKSIDDAIEIRRRVLMAFEEAELEDDEEARRAKLTFVVIGGGPTGVEMAGALREIAAMTIPQDFRRVDTTTARVYLLEGGPRLLPTMSEHASRKAKEQLEGLGVEVRLDTMVTNVDEHRVWVGDDSVPAANVVWAAGVRGSPLAESVDHVALDDQGRIRVEPDCSIPGHPGVFVVGDLAAQTDAETGEPVPGVAQGAIQMGAFVGDIIRRELAGELGQGDRPAFTYDDKGEMATIGRARAVADISGRSFSGWFAWLLWSVVHVTFLVGFRNKLLVMIHWAWQWVIQSRGARLITGPSMPTKDAWASGLEAGSEAERRS
ncbi:MAG: NAD(P)/FAD-dependent oxidoreductase [Longimicrobiales bacterium]|nr:NAD(P)/FAD-dependent oxidoreductase [Longimicrobiales bacterium]